MGTAGTAFPLLYHPRIGAYSTAVAEELPSNPDDQVEQTISRMCQYAREDASSPEIRDAVSTALYESGDGDPLAAVWNYVRMRMTFSNDSVVSGPAESATGRDVIEVLIRPRDIHTWWEGDCDDYASLGASMLIAMGIPVRFATVAADRRAPGEYSHVYLVAYPKGAGRIPMDLSHGQGIGWEVPNRFGKLREWDCPGAEESASNLLGFAVAAGLGWMAMRKGRR